MKLFHIFFLLCITHNLFSQDKHVQIDLNDAGDAYVLCEKGLYYNKKNHLDTAKYYFENALRIALSARPPDSQLLEKIYFSLETLCYYSQQYDKAMEYNAAIISLKQLIYGERSAELAKSYTNRGVYYFQQSDFGNALIYYKKAYLIFSDLYSEESPHLINIYINIGSIYNYQGDFETALMYYDKSLILLKNIQGQERAEYYVLNNMGSIYQQEMNFPEAIIQYRKALEMIRLFSKSDTYYDLIPVYLNLSVCYSKMKEYDSATICVDEALKLLSENYSFKKLLQAEAYVIKGEIFFQQGQVDSALVLFQKAQILNSFDFVDTSLRSNARPGRSYSSILEFNSFHHKAEALYFKYMHCNSRDFTLEEILHVFDLAVRSVNIIRKKFNENSLISFNRDSRSLFSDLVAIYYDLYEKGDQKALEYAFSYAEKIKSHVLFGALVNAKAIQLGGIDASELQQEKDLRERIYALEIRISEDYQQDGSIGTSFLKDMESEYLFLLESYDSMISGFESRYPRYYELKYQTEPVALNTLQKEMDDDITLLDYFIGDTSLFVFLIRSDKAVMYRIPVEEDLKSRVEKYFRNIKKLDSKSFTENSFALYQKLIKPVESELSTKVCILPDEYLFYLPFETLISREEKRYNSNIFRVLPYMIRKYEIQYHYSASLWYAIKTEGNNRTYRETSFLGFAPVFDDDYWAQIESKRASNTDLGLNNLPYSEKEVTEIAEKFENKGFTSDVALRKEASKKLFLEYLNEYTHIHLATHGFMNDREPNLSRLAFYPENNELFEINNQDVFLYAAELYNQKMNADLLVLSACETGVGKLVSGEGMITLSRAALYSGVNNIIYTLWNVTDSHTCQIMDDFYTYWLNGESYSNALRMAKLKMIDNPNTAFPAYWTAMVLLGL